MTFLESVALTLNPFRDFFAPFLGFDAFVSLVLTILVAVVILQNRRKNQSISSDVEDLIRRYIIFRSHRQALMKIHQGDEKVKHEILRTISNSWGHFKSSLGRYSTILYETDRRTRNLLLILGATAVLNTLRILAFGALTGRAHWAGLILLVRELPTYLFLATGFLLISIQSHRLGKGPLNSFNGELEAIFSDTQKIQEALDNEFDPIDESIQKEEPWKEES